MSKLQLQSGKFYVDRQQNVWCCYRVERPRDEHCQADCIRVVDSRTEYFYLDGRHNASANHELRLVKEVEP